MGGIGGLAVRNMGKGYGRRDKFWSPGQRSHGSLFYVPVLVGSGQAQNSSGHQWTSGRV